MTRVTVVLKTNEGGMWALPQIEELVQRGADVTVVVPPGAGRLRRALDAAGRHVVESPFDFRFRPGVGLARGLWALRRVLRDSKPDVIFYHLYASALASRLASIGLGARRVHMVAGPLYLENAGIRLAERFLCRLDSQLIAGSAYTARAYAALGMPPGRLSAIPYGVDTDRFQRVADERVSLLGAAPDTFVVAMVAYVYAPKSSVFPGVGIKGHDVLLDAWEHFTAKHPDSLLVLVGSGFDDDGEAHRQRLIEQHGIAGSSTIRWFDSVEDVRPLYSSADVSVSPSLSENHGAALEASSMGLPCIVSDAGGLPETVTTETGWVVPAGDSVALLAALEGARAEFDDATLRSRGAAARLLMEREFALERAVRAVVTVVLERPSAGHGVVAFTEQRTWLVEGQVIGRKVLPIVSSLARTVPVRLAVRVGPGESGGTPIAPAAIPAPLAWPTGTPAFSMLSDAWATLRTMVKAVRGARVVYADQPGLVGGLGLALGYAAGRPLAVNVVGDSAESVHPSVVPGIKGRVAHAILPRLQRWACSHAEVANYVTARVLQERYPPTRASQVFASSTVTALGPARPRTLPRDRPVSVVTVASLEQPYKGVRDLVDAIALCRSQGLDVRLTVLGEGRLRSELERHAAQVAPGRVAFRGHLYGTEIYDELGHHDVFALASWTEGLPRALVEAMADGLPAVASSVGGVPDILEPHRTFPPREPRMLAATLRELLSDRAGWDATIQHNLEVSDAMFARRASTLDGFVDAVATLAGPLHRSST